MLAKLPYGLPTDVPLEPRCDSLLATAARIEKFDPERIAFVSYRLPAFSLKTLQIDGYDREKKMSFGEWRESVRRLASSLVREGFRKNEVCFAYSLLSLKIYRLH